VRRDADGIERTAPTWESLTERLIREAQDEGRFDDLPGQGRPLHLDDDVLAGEMAMAHHLLRNAGAAPPWIETDKSVRRQRERIEELLQRARRSSPLAADRLRSELEQLADAHDEAVRHLESLAPTPRQRRATLDRAQLRARLAGALGARGDR
jgi:hypothetical protein